LLVEAEPVFTIAHISDLHIGDPRDSVGRAERVVAHVCSLDPAPDLLLVTGDVADHGTAEEYAAARAVLGAWSGPLLVGTGNHDVRGPFAEVLLEEARSGPLNQALEIGGARFLMLDSLVPARDGVRIDHGELEPETLDWLADQLGVSDRPTFVCFHHPAVPIGIALADEIGLRNADQLEAVLAGHPHHVATLVGHNHTACATTYAGRPMLIGGGVVSSLTLDAEPQPHVWNDAPPSLAFHFLGEDGRLTTHWRALA
jgi:3',5'-cyclic AMP phosphodiesterase CpdA